MGRNGIGVTLNGPLQVSRGKANTNHMKTIETIIVPKVDPRSRSFARREFWRGYRRGSLHQVITDILIVIVVYIIYHY